MAEYINRERVIEFVRNYPHYDFDSLVEELYELPTADVIERSKIDKAITKIKQDMIAHSGTGEEVIQAYCDGLKKALEYLENIGE